MYSYYDVNMTFGRFRVNLTFALKFLSCVLYMCVFISVVS